MIKKHLKPTKENKGGIISKESFIHISNLALLDVKSKTKKDRKHRITIGISAAGAATKKYIWSS